MTDYDLGRAQGRIEIDTDVDADGAARKLARIRESVNRMGRDFQKVERDMNRFEKTVARIQAVAAASVRSLGSMTRSVSEMGRTTATAVANIVGLNKGLQNLRNSATSAAQGLLAAKLAMSQMSSAAFVARNAMMLLTGASKELSNFPKWARHVVTGASALGSVTKAATSARVAMGQKLVPWLRASVAGFAGLSASAVLFGNKMRIATFALGMAFPQLNRVAGGIGNLNRSLRVLGPAFKGMLDGMSRAVVGAAVFTSGLKGLGKTLGQIAPMFKYLVAGLASLSAIGPVASVLLGVVDAVKQLSGALLLLPGALAVLGAVGGTLILSVVGISKAFKAGLEDADKFEEKLKDVAPGLQGFARDIQSLKKPFAELRDEVTATTFATLIRQFKPMAEQYLPLLKSGLGTVGGGLDRVIASFIRFARQKQTMNDFNQLFGDTRLVLNNVARSVEPFMAGLRNIGTVGSAQLAKLTGGLSNTAHVFEAWTNVVSNDGSIDRWIEESLKGFSDLWSAIKDISGAIGDVLRAVGGDGDNALSKLAEGAEKFRAAVDGSIDSGFIGQVIDKLSQASTNTIEVLVEAISELYDVFKAFGPVMSSFSDAFSGTLQVSLKVVGGLLQGIGEALSFLNNIGFGSLIGTIVALGAAFKVAVVMIGPFLNALKLLGGAAVITGMSQMFLNAAAAVDTFGRKATAVSGVTSKVSNVLLNLSSLMTGPFLAGVAAAGLAITMFVSAQQKQAAAQQKIRDDYAASAEAARDFAKAVSDANGKLNEEAMGKLTESVSKFREGLAGEAKDDAKWNNVASDIFGDTFKGMFGAENDDISERMDKAAQKAQAAKASLDELGLSNRDLANYLVAGDDTWASFIARLEQTSNGGQEAINRFTEYRNRAQAVTLTNQAIGESNLQIANGMRTLADASSSASDKLQALKDVLVGMGIIKTTAAEATAEWTKRTNEMADSATRLLDNVNGMTTGIFKADGSLDAMTAGGAEAVSFLANLRDGYLANAQATGNAKVAYDQLTPTFQALAKELGISEEKVRELAASYGIVPDQVQTLVSINGLDAAKVDILAVMAELNNVPEGKDTTIHVETKEGLDALRKAGVEVKEWNPETQGAKINIPPGLGAEAKEKIRQQLIAAGVPIAQVNAALNKPSAEAVRKELEKPVDKTVNVKYATGENGKPVNEDPLFGKGLGVLTPEAAAEKRKNPGPAKQAPPAAPGAPAPVPANPQTPEEAMPQKVVKQFELQGTDAAIGAVNAVRTAIAAMGDPVVRHFQLAGTDAAIGAVNAVRTALDSMAGQTTKNFQLSGTDAAIGAANAVIVALANIPAQTVKNFELAGTDAAIGATNAVVIAVQNLANQVDGAMNRAAAAVGRFAAAVTDVKAKMDNVASASYNSGQTLAQNFANGINSRVDQVRQAAMNLANAASAPLPRSPAKIGPFSGRGWTPYRGQSLAEGFAKGINNGAGTTQDAALDMVAQIAKAMDSIRVGLGLTPTGFEANNHKPPGGKQYYRDPEITNEELKKAREEKAANQAEKDELDAEKAATKVPDAEKKVEEAKVKVIEAEERARKAREKANGPQKNQKAEQSAEKSALNAEESLTKAKERLTKAEDKLKELQSQSQGVPPADIQAQGGGVGANGSLRPNMTNKDYQGAMNAIAARFGLQNTSGYRAESGSWHATGQAADFSNGVQTDQELAFANFINDNFKPWTEELIYQDPRFSGKQIDSGKNVDDSFFAGAGDHTNHVHWAVKFPPEFVPEMSKSVKDGTKQGTEQANQSNVKTIPLVAKGGGKYGSSNPEWDKLINRESGGDPKIVQGISDANSGGNEASGLFQIAKGTWAANGGLKYGAEARNATPEQQAEIAAKIFEKSGGSPWGSGAGQNLGRENENLLRAGLTNGQPGGSSFTGDTNKIDLVSSNTEDTVTELRKNNKKLDESIRVAEDPKSSDKDVIQALQSIDTEMVGMSATERKALDGIREGVMTDRGIKEYDPYENAPETPEDWFNTIFQGLAQNFLSLFKTFESGLSGAINLVHQFSRGFANTNDVMNAIDSVQDMAGMVIDVISTVGSIVETVANIAAAAGSAIPGIGQVSAVIGAVGGVASNINAVVDFAQEVFKIGSRLFGGALSSVLGLGGTGQLQGQIKTLLDMNDMTIKTWSDRNSADKSVMGLPGTTPTDPNAAPGWRDLNIYQGPGTSPSEMMENAMFAVAAHSSGVYGG